MKAGALVVVLALAAPPLQAAIESPAAAVSRFEIAVERELVAAILDELADARRRESSARQTVEAIASRLDDAIATAGTARHDDARALDSELASARQIAERWGDEAARLRQTLFEHWRRIAVLESRTAGEAPISPREGDLISGSWTVRLLPSGQLFVFDLTLDVAIISGRYRGEGIVRGSLRGTLVGDLVTLERVDTQRGTDLVFEGRLDRERGEIRGTWRSTLLTSADAAGGNWVAFRQPVEYGEASESR